MKILINGGCGFLGSNLASYGIDNGYEITVFDNLSRTGTLENLSWLKTKGRFEFIPGDVRNKEDVESVIRNGSYDAIFHLAGQVAMTTSVADPYKDFQINAMGTLHTLEAVRKYSPRTHVFFSSTNKVYGSLDQYTYTEKPTRFVCNEFPNGFDESVPLDFSSPYGCSKGAADQYMRDYGRTFGLNTTVFRHSSMYGSRQFATYDQGWIGWFCKKALDLGNGIKEQFTVSGNGKQVRDILHADDMISLYYTALEKHDSVSGKTYNIGGTIEQSLSLLELFDILDRELGVEMKYEKLPPRLGDQKVFVADVGKICNDIGWKPKVSATEGISSMLRWVDEL